MPTVKAVGVYFLFSEVFNMPIIVERNKTIKVNYNDNNIKSCNYPKNDLSSVYKHWDSNLKKNVFTEKNHYTKYKEGR